MKMKKVLALTLGAALSFSLLAACSGGSAETPAPETTTPAETTPAETTPAETAPAGDYGEFTTVGRGQAHHVHQRPVPSL